MLDDFPEYNPVDKDKLNNDRASSESAVYNTSLTNSSDSVNDYSVSKANLSEDGTDPSVDNTKMELAESNNQVVADTAIDILADPLIDLKTKQNVATIANGSMNSLVDLEKEFSIKEAVSLQPNATSDAEVQQWYIESMLPQYDTDRAIRSHVNAFIKANTPERVKPSKRRTNMSRGQAGPFTPQLIPKDADFFGALAPFNKAISANRILVKVFGEEESSLLNLATAGESIEFMRNKLRQETNPELRKEMASNLLNAINDESGTLSENNLIKVQIANDIFKEELNPNRSLDDTNWDRVIDNVIGALDLVMLGQLAGFIARGGMRILKGTPIEVASQANPDTTKNLIAVSLLDETGKVANALGVTKVELAESVFYPKPLSIQQHQKMPADVAEVISDVQSTGSVVVKDTESSGFAFTQSEKDRASKSTQEALNSTTGAKIYSGMSNIAADSEGMTIVATYGNTTKFGFPNGLEAVNRGRALYPEAEVTVLKRNRAGEIVKTNKLSGKGEYFFQIKERRAYDKDDVGIYSPNEVRATNFFTTQIMSPAAKFSKQISNIGSILVGREKKVQKDLIRLTKEFTSLSTKSKNKVSDLIMKGYKDGVDYSYDELASVLTNQEVKGYYVMRGLEGIKYTVENRKLYKALKSENMLHVTNRSGNETIAAVITQKAAKANVKTVYDPSTGKISAMSIDDITNLYENGGTIAKGYGKQIDKGQTTKYVLIQEADGTRMTGLPMMVLNRQAGYITRTYKNNYFIREQGSVVNNGVKDTFDKAIATASTEREALDMIAELSSRNAIDIEDAIDAGRIPPPVKKYTPTLGRELTDKDIGAIEKSFNLSNGSLFTSKRGDHLKSSTDFGIAEIDNPIESILNNIAAVSKHAASEDVIVSMQQRWLNSYSGFFNGKYPTSINDFKLREAGAVLYKAEANELARAKEMWEYINLIKHTPTSGNLSTARRSIIKFGEWVIGTGHNGVMNAVGNKVVDIGAVNINSKLRTVPFNMYLALNPIRQLPLQASQVALLSALEPKLFADIITRNGLLRQNIGLQAMMLYRNDSIKFKEAVKMVAKISSGQTEKELIELVEAFCKTGLSCSIDSHTFLKDSLESTAKVMHTSPLRSGVARVARLPSDAVSLLRTGFEYGEYLNLMNTWLLARHRWIKENPKKDWLSAGAQAEIGGNARGYALNMTKQGSFKYQEGAIGTILQFFSITHKAMESMTTSRFFTPAEKRRVALGQLVLWGGAGFGISEIYESVRDANGVETTPEMDRLITGGLVELTLNGMLSEIYKGESPQIKIAQIGAPASGVMSSNIQRMLLGLFEGGTLLESLRNIPAVGAGNKIFDALAMSKSIVTHPEIDTKEKILKITKNIAMLSSGYNNYVKMQMARKLGYFSNNSGDPTVKAATAEAIAKLWGFQSEKEVDYTKVNQAIYSDISGARHSGLIKDTAKTYYNRMTRRLSTLNDEYPSSLDQLYLARIEEAIKEEAVILSMFADPLDREAVLAEFHNLIGKKALAGEDTIISQITDLALKNQKGSGIDTIITTLKNSGLVDTPEKETQLKELMEYLTEERKLLEEQREQN